MQLLGTNGMQTDRNDFFEKSRDPKFPCKCCRMHAKYLTILAGDCSRNNAKVSNYSKFRSPGRDPRAHAAFGRFSSDSRGFFVFPGSANPSRHSTECTRVSRDPIIWNADKASRRRRKQRLAEASRLGSRAWACRVNWPELDGLSATMR